MCLMSNILKVNILISQFHWALFKILTSLHLIQDWLGIKIYLYFLNYNCMKSDKEKSLITTLSATIQVHMLHILSCRLQEYFLHQLTNKLDLIENLLLRYIWQMNSDNNMCYSIEKMKPYCFYTIPLPYIANLSTMITLPNMISILLVISFPIFVKVMIISCDPFHSRPS